VPLLLLDTGVEGNREDHRTLRDRLYGGDERYRLCQETVLGIGGVRVLRALGYSGMRAKHEAPPEDDLLIVLVDLHGGASAPQAQPKAPGSAG
jgi:starch phosphorylase